MQKNILLIFLGLFSGCISAIICIRIDPFLLYTIPGIIFGIMFLVAVLLLKSSVKKYASALLIFAFIGNFIAVSSVLDFHLPEALGLVIGGALGTFIMLVGYSLFIRTLTPPDFTILTILGSLLSLSFYVIPLGTFFPTDNTPPFGDIMPEEHIISIYIIWQSLMVLFLGQYLPKRKNT